MRKNYTPPEDPYSKSAPGELQRRKKTDNIPGMRKSVSFVASVREIEAVAGEAPAVLDKKGKETPIHGQKGHDYSDSFKRRRAAKQAVGKRIGTEEKDHRKDRDWVQNNNPKSLQGREAQREKADRIDQALVYEGQGRVTEVEALDRDADTRKKKTIGRRVKKALSRKTDAKDQGDVQELVAKNRRMYDYGPRSAMNRANMDAQEAHGTSDPEELKRMSQSLTRRVTMVQRSTSTSNLERLVESDAAEGNKQIPRSKSFHQL